LRQAPGQSTSVFDLPDRLSSKTDSALIAGTPKTGLVIGYGGIHPERIVEGLRLLRTAIRQPAS
jgi:hypothetical protein